MGCIVSHRRLDAARGRRSGVRAAGDGACGRGDPRGPRAVRRDATRRRDGSDHPAGTGARVHTAAACDDAAELLAAAPLDSIAFGFTSSAYVIGAHGEDAMVARLERRTRGLPVVTASAATVDALGLLDARRIALLAPPCSTPILSRWAAPGAIAALEARLGLPVVTANQALLWAALCAAGADAHVVTGYGRLFARSA